MQVPELGPFPIGAGRFRGSVLRYGSIVLIVAYSEEFAGSRTVETAWTQSSLTS
jgi:hypothetical protein